MPIASVSATPGSLNFSPMISANGHASTLHLVNPSTLSSSAKPSISIPLLKPVNGPKIFSGAAASNAAGPTQLAGLAVNTKAAGLDIVTAQEGGFYWHPSDGSIAAGPKDVIQCVNVACEIWDKATGQSLGAFNPPVLFGTADFYVGDPMVFFDSLSGHFFLSSADFQLFLGGTQNTYFVAVSATSDPTGVWYVYTLNDCYFCASTTNFLFGDQPRIGADSQFFAQSSNVFNASSGLYVSGVLQVWNKTQMITGGVVFGREVDLGPSWASVQPAISLSATKQESFITGVNWFSGSANVLEEWLIGGTIASPTVTVKHVTLPHSMVQPPAADQPSGAGTLNTDDNRITSVMYSKGDIWFTYNDACIPAGDTIVRPCGGIGEVTAKPLAVLQQFDIGINKKDVFYPALSVGSMGMVAVFGYSSLKDYPGVKVSGQAIGDPVNSFRAPITIAVGFSSDNSGRWGDYFGAATDPSSTSNVWVEGTYSGSSPTLIGANWATEIAEVTV